LRRISTPLIVQRLRHICDVEHITIDDDALLAVARGADGGMRDALSALDQLISFKGDTLAEEDVLAVFGLVSRKSLEALAGHILKGEMAEMLTLVDAFEGAGKDLRRLTVELLGHFRNLMVYQALGGESGALEATPEQLHVLQAQSALAEPARVLRVAEELVETEERLRRTLSVRTQLETALIRCGRAATAVTLEQVLRRLNALRQSEPVGAPSAAAGTPAAAPRNPRGVLEDPIVKRALELFDGKVVDVEE